MSDVNDLVTRIEGAFTSVKEKLKRQQQEQLHAHLDRQRLLKLYEKAQARVVEIARSLISSGFIGKVHGFRSIYAERWDRYPMSTEYWTGWPSKDDVYGFLTPSVNAAKKPGEWQTFDVTFVGRVVTVELNGERLIDRQAIPGITGGALDSDEGSPGPIMVQGDHGPIDFRKVTLTPGR